MGAARGRVNSGFFFKKLPTILRMQTLFEAYERCTTHGLDLPGVTGNGHPHKKNCKVGKSAHMSADR